MGPKNNIPHPHTGFHYKKYWEPDGHKKDFSIKFQRVQGRLSVSNCKTPEGPKKNSSTEFPQGPMKGFSTKIVDPASSHRIPVLICRWSKEGGQCQIFRGPKEGFRYRMIRRSKHQRAEKSI
jgi:hypothetical protein